MSSDSNVIRVDRLSKCYQIYDRPHDRLKQFVAPRVRNMLGRPPVNYFREFWALRDVSFNVGRGETVGIIGRNGSGKSTLLQMICGTLMPTSGTVETHGRVAALLELGAGFNPEFTGRENVFLNAMVLGLSQSEVEQRFDEIAAFADIGQFIEQPVKHYSSGMYARLAFAVAINVDPDILVVDEALAVGDEPFQRKCFARIDAIKNRGATILFVSHSGAAIINLCDRAILLNAGERLFTGIPKRAVYFGQKLGNTTGDKAIELIAEIRRIDAEGESAASAAEPETEEKKAAASETPTGGLEPFFDASFVPD
ncbi:MAG: ABC transporter ATP-binding protein, partial [Pseudomonadales bacterium]